MKRLGVSLTDSMLKWSMLYELLLILMAFQQISWVFPKFEQFDMGLSFGLFIKTVTWLSLPKTISKWLYWGHHGNLHYWTEVTTRFFLLPVSQNGISNGAVARNSTKWRFMRKMFLQIGFQGEKILGSNFWNPNWN